MLRKLGIDLPPHFYVRTLDTGEPAPRQYLVYVPPDYRPEEPMPLLICLHGSGERGYNSHNGLRVGLPPYIRSKRLNDFPFIALFPQVSDMWFRGRNEQWVWRMIDAVMQEYRVDADRVYLTGLSMGGFGTWELAMRRPDRFAAIAPICGGALEPELLANLRTVPIWAFHGALDDRVPVKFSRDLVNGLIRGGIKPKYTEYADLGHFCWDRAYATRSLYDWLLQHRRAPRPRALAYFLPQIGVALPWRVWWFQFDQIGNGSKRPVVAGRFEADDRLVIQTRNVAKATICADGLPIESGKPLTVIWNGVTVFSGPLAGDITRSMAEPASRAASQSQAPRSTTGDDEARVGAVRGAQPAPG